MVAYDVDVQIVVVVVDASYVVDIHNHVVVVVDILHVVVVVDTYVVAAFHVAVVVVDVVDIVVVVHVDNNYIYNIFMLDQKCYLS